MRSFRHVPLRGGDPTPGSEAVEGIVSSLAWDHFGMPQEELECNIRERDVWISLQNLLQYTQVRSDLGMRTCWMLVVRET